MSKEEAKNNPKPKKIEIHIVTLGDSQVGKTSLILRYTDNFFAEEYLTTVGIDLKFKKMQSPNGEELRVKISDTAGQERFKSIATNYLKKANGILLVYDITNKDSFKNIDTWANEITSEQSKHKPIILLGNKSDMNEKRVISKEKGEEFAKNCCGGIKFYETSCKTGENVEKAIDDLVFQIYNLKISGKNTEEEDKFKIKKEKKGKEKKKSKC